MEIFKNILDGLSYYRYAVAFFLAIFEGPMAMVAAGILLRLNFFYFWPIYLSLMLGDFVADLGWYAVGRFGGRKFVERFGKYFSLTSNVLQKIEHFFHKHQDKILIISKLTMGFGFAVATLFTAGMVRVSFKKYVLFNFLGGFIWTGLLIATGYFFGQLYTLIGKSFRAGFLVFLTALVMAVLYGAGKYFKQKIVSD